MVKMMFMVFRKSGLTREQFVTEWTGEQHLSFILGVVFYCVATTASSLGFVVFTVPEVWARIAPLFLIAVFVAVGLFSHRREAKGNR